MNAGRPDYHLMTPRSLGYYVSKSQRFSAALSSEREMAPGEGFEPPWGDPSGFRDHRPTGLGDPGA